MRGRVDVTAALAELALVTGDACYECGEFLDITNRLYATSRYNDFVRLCAADGAIEALAGCNVFKIPAIGNA